MPNNILAVKADENQSLVFFLLDSLSKKSLEKKMPKKAETLTAGFFALMKPEKSKVMNKKAKMIERM